MVKKTTLFIAGVVLVGLATAVILSRRGWQSVTSGKSAEEAYRVRDKRIIELAQRLLQTTDEQVDDLIMPNPHPQAQWFPEAGLGLFMHWGIHSVVGAQPSWAMIKDYIWAGPVFLHPPEKYYALAGQFDPQNWHPQKWLKTAKDAGFQYAVLTTKHHDGYALWPSRYGNLSTRQVLDGRDLLADYVEGCRRNGLKVGFYFSPRDWHYPNFPLNHVDFDANKTGQYPEVDPQLNRRRFEQFFTFTIAQLHEILTRYGTIDLLWFDGMGWHGIDDMHTKAVYQWVRTLQPHIVINDRWGKVRNPDDTQDISQFGDFLTIECRRAEERPQGWWETCDIWDTGGGWGYDTNEGIRSLEWTLSSLIRCRQWGGNFLPNVGPRPDGEMTRGFYERCAELQEWMARHGESVIATLPPPADSVANVPLTCREHTWYLHVAPEQNRTGAILVRPPRPISEAVIMRTGSAVAFERREAWYRIQPPPGKSREVIRLTLSSQSDE